MEKLTITAAPHIHSGASTSRIMLDVIIALLPVTVASVVIFGLQALVVIAACVISAVAAEFLFNLAAGKKNTLGDMSAVVTGLLLALNLSTNVPVWQCAVGAAFAIVCIKCFFGGLGCNFANPAIAGRVFMLLTFSQVAGGANPTIVDVVSSATPLEQLAKGGEDLPSLLDMFLGLHGGAIGETCAAALLVGFVYLLVRKVITWHTPVVFVATVFVCYLVATGFDVVAALYQVLGGGLMIGAIFMATDYVTTPINTRGRMVFALGCGVITFIIRYFCAYPEGVSFSILIMNILTPYIEKWTASEPLGGVK
ncbi:MAG: RnfABCDGE type electron transport complex subunit D [Oscillospiraceae bacterium]|nr:RnfABCDGE type electron transport complex subunit D [Oscillospiraceae bacterium]